jgi:hypothetical protein
LKVKKLCTSKKTISRMETIHRLGDNFGIYSTDKGLISTIYKELTKINNRRYNNPINKWGNELNR